MLIAVLSLAWVPPWLTLPVVLWAPLVAWARVAMGLHYISDVLAGAVVGGLVAAMWLLLAL
jgi:undecaprenyl-diphosphatase